MPTQGALEYAPLGFPAGRAKGFHVANELGIQLKADLDSSGGGPSLCHAGNIPADSREKSPFRKII